MVLWCPGSPPAPQHLHLDKKYIRLELITVSGAAKPHSRHTHTHTHAGAHTHNATGEVSFFKHLGCKWYSQQTATTTLREKKIQISLVCVCLCLWDRRRVCREDDVRYGWRICYRLIEWGLSDSTTVCVRVCVCLRVCCEQQRKNTVIGLERLRQSVRLNKQHTALKDWLTAVCVCVCVCVCAYMCVPVIQRETSFKLNTCSLQSGRSKPHHRGQTCRPVKSVVMASETSSLSGEMSSPWVKVSSPRSETSSPSLEKVIAVSRSIVTMTQMSAPWGENVIGTDRNTNAEKTRWETFARDTFLRHFLVLVMVVMSGWLQVIKGEDPLMPKLACIWSFI